MASLTNYSKYVDTPLTNFPESEDNKKRMTDVSATLMNLVKQYNDLWNAGNLTECNNLLTSHPELQDCFFNADKYNWTRDAIIALQRFFLEEVDAMIKDVANNTIGINDNPNEEEAKVNSYSAEKINQLFLELKNDYHTPQNVVIPASGWSEAYPFTNTVNVDWVTSEDNIKVVGVYMPDNATVGEVKSWIKASSFLIPNNDATGEGTITFKAYKKPTVDFTVMVEGE